MQNLIESIQTFLNLNGNVQEFQLKLLQTLGIVLFLWLLRFIIIKIVYYETKNLHTRHWWQKIVTYLVVVLGVIVISRTWLVEMESMVTFLGLVSAGLAVALAGPVTDLAGWLFLLWRRPFEIGDRIEIGEHAGDVIDIRIFQFALLEIGNWVAADQSTGRIIHIPNRQVFSQVLANYSEGFEYIWNEIPVLITFESDWEKAKSMLQAIANQHTGDINQIAARQLEQATYRFPIKYSKLTPIVYTRVKADGVSLTVRYLSPIRRRRGTEQALWEDILRAFAQQADINFAYPTQRLYSNWLEEQQATGQPGNIVPLAVEELKRKVGDK